MWLVLKLGSVRGVSAQPWDFVEGPTPLSLPLLRFRGRGGKKEVIIDSLESSLSFLALSRTSKLTALAPWDFYALGAGRRGFFFLPPPPSLPKPLNKSLRRQVSFVNNLGTGEHWNNNNKKLTHPSQL